MVDWLALLLLGFIILPGLVPLLPVLETVLLNLLFRLFTLDHAVFADVALLERVLTSL